tara:strand:+ start:1 stop:1803 length:1803 start_codon:yes stop_codon:yes gene_type:complete
MAGQAGLQVAGQALEGGKQILNNNTLDASEQKTLQDQKALEQAEYNKANPNVAQGGIPVMPQAYGGTIRTPLATGGPKGEPTGGPVKGEVRTRVTPPHWEGSSYYPSAKYEVMQTGPNGELIYNRNNGTHTERQKIDTAGYSEGLQFFPQVNTLQVQRPGARYSGAGDARTGYKNEPLQMVDRVHRREVDKLIENRKTFPEAENSRLKKAALGKTTEKSITKAGGRKTLTAKEKLMQKKQMATGGYLEDGHGTIMNTSAGEDDKYALGGYTDGVDPNARPLMATSEYGRPYDFEGIGTLPIRDLYESPTLATDIVMPNGDPFRSSSIGRLPTVPSGLNNDSRNANINAPFEYNTSSNTTDASPFDEDYTEEDWYKDLTEEEKEYFSDMDTDPEGDDSLDFTQTPLEMAGRLAPIGYNLVQGLRPSEQLDYDEFKDRSEISRVNPLNISPYQQGLNEQYQMALAKTGRNPAQAQALMNSANKNLGNIYLQKEQFDANQRKDYETRKQAQNVSNIRTKASIKDMNQRSEAARRNYLAETAKQAADLANSGRQDKLTLAGLKAMAPDFANNMKIASFRDQFQEWNKSQQDKRKARKDSEKSTS